MTSCVLIIVAMVLFLLSCQSLSPRGKTPHPSVGMVLIPEGSFLMGSEHGDKDEVPVHEVYLDAFYIDRYEVINKHYEHYLKSTGAMPPRYWGQETYCSGPQYPDYPVCGVNWYQANDFCHWVGKRLPTEAEWEKASRGGLEGREYPRGDQAESFPSGDGSHLLLPKGSSLPNDYGLYSMVTGVWEWCADWYQEDYYKISPAKNPKGPQKGLFKVMRGLERNANRFSSPPDYNKSFYGFRCVKELP